MARFKSYNRLQIHLSLSHLQFFRSLVIVIGRVVCVDSSDCVATGRTMSITGAIRSVPNGPEEVRIEVRVQIAIASVELLQKHQKMQIPGRQ